MKSFETEQIFILDSERGFELAEKFKSKLENKGFKVRTEPYTSNGVRITGYIN